MPRGDGMDPSAGRGPTGDIMGDTSSPDVIRGLAMDFDNAIEGKNVDSALSSFTNDCEIELLGIKLMGRDGAEKWLNWLYKNLADIKFTPITIMAEGNTLFEEYTIKAKLQNGTVVRSKQAEVLEYKNGKIRSLRLYFDRLDFADLVAKGLISKAIIRRVVAESFKGLT